MGYVQGYSTLWLFIAMESTNLGNSRTMDFILDFWDKVFFIKTMQIVHKNLTE
jgi:hypothetical protein